MGCVGSESVGPEGPPTTAGNSRMRRTVVGGASAPMLFAQVAEEIDFVG
ncbi:DUF6053 domain-containing protein [Lysobacter yananisis]